MYGENRLNNAYIDGLTCFLKTYYGDRVRRKVKWYVAYICLCLKCEILNLKKKKKEV